MKATIQHNLSDAELVKALAALADESEIGEPLLKAIRAKNIDTEPKEPRHRATKELYRMLQGEFAKAARDIQAYAGEITAVPLQKAIAPVSPVITHDQMIQLAQAINGRYGFIAAQLQSVDYQPDPAQLERWKQLGLVHPDATTATFMASIPEEMHIIRNAFLLGKFYEAVESGKTFAEVMDMARYAPLLKPDLAAIQIAEQQTAMYLTDNAADLVTKVQQLAIQKRNETIRQMAVDFHARKLKRTVPDREEKQEAGIPTPDRPVETWQQFKSELYRAIDDKTRDLDRVAFYEITDAQKQGQAARLLADGNVEKLVYKTPMPTACAQCKHVYLLADGKTPKLHRLSELVNNGTNIGRRSHPTKGGKVTPGGRPDGQETMKAVAGLMHPWCQCGGPYEATGYEHWLTPKQKEIIKQYKTKAGRQAE